MLANDSKKFRGKKDRKYQRASFRDIYGYVAKHEEFTMKIQVGPARPKQELLLSTWALRLEYQAICHALEDGSNNHLNLNVTVSIYLI